MESNLPKRKNIRLKVIDYNCSGAYFITICTKDRRAILSSIVGTGVLDGPQIKLTQYGDIADKYIKQLNEFYDNMSIESYVIMKTDRRGRRSLRCKIQPCRALYRHSRDFATKKSGKIFGNTVQMIILYVIKRIMMST